MTDIRTRAKVTDDELFDASRQERRSRRRRRLESGRQQRRIIVRVQRARAAAERDRG